MKKIGFIEFSFMFIWPVLVVLAGLGAIAILTGCGSDSGGGSEPAATPTETTTTTVDVDWETDEVLAVREGCVEGIEQTDSALYYESYQFSVFCSCAVEGAQERWTFDDYVSHEDEYNAVLAEEGVLEACNEKAFPIKWTEAQYGAEVASCQQNGNTEGFCECLNTTAARRWGYLDVMADPQTAAEILVNDGTYAYCEQF